MPEPGCGHVRIVDPPTDRPDEDGEVCLCDAIVPCPIHDAEFILGPPDSAKE